MARNAFEGNESEITQESLGDIKRELFMTLPPVPEGKKYALKTVGTRQVILIEE